MQAHLNLVEVSAEGTGCSVDMVNLVGLHPLSTLRDLSRGQYRCHT